MGESFHLSLVASPSSCRTTSLETGPSNRLVLSKHGERHNRVGETNRPVDARQLRDIVDVVKILFTDGECR